MRKDELMEAVHERRESGYPKKHVEKAVNDAFDIIASTLAKGEKVVVTGFGTFEVVERKAKTGRNPRTGVAIPIPATKAVKFKPSKFLKEAVK
ncbi:HU family DNA-binding protein [uncultured Pseudodesulfovibrio sp.]|uniref:HU family DNA-binding protein n=1 Tax=uncultured Pseudodesulfovibrio sp. TaxID=2035858 RepID=UPI0029C69D8B|nr:HU family DNA-binding protein [uncultured Pseudodesulfovibrio sp.]